MNTVIMMGRLTRDPEIRYSTGESATAIAHYRLAVDRRFKRDGQPEADFFDCVAFGRQAEFAEKYLHQGTKMVIQGRLQNDNYQDTNSAAYRASADPAASAARPKAKTAAAPEDPGDGFMNIPDSIDEELPFN